MAHKVDPGRKRPHVIRAGPQFRDLPAADVEQGGFGARTWFGIARPAADFSGLLRLLITCMIDARE
jgi:hypothetical protein